jgi:hypothetical protein
MKKFIFLLSFLFAFSAHSQVIFQSDFEDWTGGIPDGWNGVQTNIGLANFIQNSTTPQSGMYSCQLVNTSSSHKRFTTTGLPVVSGESYDITFWVMGDGEIRTGFYNGVDAQQNVYNSYITVNSATWTMYTQTVTSNQTNNDGEFIFSLRNTNDITHDHLSIDNITIQVSGLVVDTVSIYDIQFTTDPGGDSPFMDQIVYTYGVVTAAGSGGFFIQDGTGPWSGLYIFNNTFTVSPGDSVLCRGKIIEFNEMTEMTQVASVDILGTTSVPQPTVITTAQVNTEEYESVLIRVVNANCTNADAGFGMWGINDGSGATLVDDVMFAYTPTLGQSYNVTGPAFYSFDEFKILPRNASDVEIYTSVDEPLKTEVNIFPNPATDYVSIHVSDASDVNITNILGQVVYAVNQSGNTTNVNVSQWQSGIYFVTVTNTSGEKSSYKLLKN